MQCFRWMTLLRRIETWRECCWYHRGKSGVRHQLSRALKKGDQCRCGISLLMGELLPDEECDPRRSFSRDPRNPLRVTIDSTECFSTQSENEYHEKNGMPISLKPDERTAGKRFKERTKVSCGCRSEIQGSAREKSQILSPYLPPAAPATTDTFGTHMRVKLKSNA